MFREIAGIMLNPLKMFNLGEQMLTGRKPGRDTESSEGQRSSMYSHIIELTSKPGQAKQLIDAIRDIAIPQVIRPSQGFIDEIVLLSAADPNHVSAISFWRSREDGELFFSTGFAKVRAITQAFLSRPPERSEFVVGASTNNQIVGWGS